MKPVLRQVCTRVLCLLLWLPAFSHAGEKRLALAMGVSEYEGGGLLGSLEGIDTDVQSFVSSAKNCQFRVTRKFNPAIADAKAAILEFCEQLAESSQSGPTAGMFYFSGHGIEVKGKLYLMPKDAVINADAVAVDKESAVELGWVLEQMKGTGASVNILLLDCCRSSLPTMGAGVLSRLDPTDCFIGYATTATRDANGTFQGSPYTLALSSHMQRPGIPITTMHTDVTGAVRVMTRKLGKEQFPIQTSGLSQQFKMMPDGTSPWVFSDSSTRVLTSTELNNLTDEELWKARNEIYARKGYIFSTPKGQRYADSLTAGDYRGISGDMLVIEASFNLYEKVNVIAIKNLEATR